MLGFDAIVCSRLLCGLCLVCCIGVCGFEDAMVVTFMTSECGFVLLIHIGRLRS